MSAQDSVGTLKDGTLSRHVCLPILEPGDLASSEVSVACVRAIAQDKSLGPCPSPSYG